MDDRFGFNRGGHGGTSVMGRDAGGGGGYGAVLQNNKQLIVSAGGGGGCGTTDYCCSHGGSGSGSKGINGSSPQTPISLEQDDDNLSELFV